MAGAGRRRMTRWADLRASRAFGELMHTAERLGRNPLQVQGPGGNVSIKADGAMWVKASGTWLAEAREKDIMVPVDAAALTAALDQDRPDHSFVPSGVAATDLRPSIETSFHAALPWPVVLHTHCVATIATAIRTDAAQIVRDRLADFGAVFVPYVQPGRDLTRAILSAITPETRVIILGNHGLICCGETPDAAESLLGQVSAALEPNQVSADDPTIDLGPYLRMTGWVAGPPQAQALGSKQTLLDMAQGGTLYPDHLVFLGPGVAVTSPDLSSREAFAKTDDLDPPRRLALLPGLGAAVPAGSSSAVLAMARCLGDVLARVPPGTELNRLTSQEEAALLNWDAEAYRKSLANPG